MINKLLITCLQRNKRLVIPTLGAFIRKNIEGVGVILVFVPFLNKDDGVLCSAIKSWAGVEDQEAAQILEEYIVAVKKSLDERGQYIIEGIGVLKYDTNRIIYLAKESEAIKEEIGKPIIEQKAEQEKVVEPITVAEPKPIIQEQKISTPTPTQVPIPHHAPAVNEESNPVVEVVENAPVEISEPVKEPQNPQYNRPIYDRAVNATTDMGTRYFSPVRKPDPLNSQKPEQQQQGEPQPKQSLTSMYGGQPQQRENSSFGKYRDSQDRINNIYRSGAASNPPPVPMQHNNGPATPTGVMQQHHPQHGQRQMKPSQKKKGNDIVLWIAVIAVVLTIIVLVYGYIYGGEQTISTEELIEQVQAPATDSPTESIPTTETP
ncbi:MAG: hypothetical protein RR277_05435, partial [Rikenellaceae bacterium]